MSADRIWQVILPDGTAWIPPDSRSDDPRSSWIYARSTAEMFADALGGRVAEVTPRQKEKVLDVEIATALAAPSAPRSTKTVKTRKRPFSQSARKAIAAAVLEYVPFNYPARSAIDTARETDDDGEYRRALKTLQAALPDVLWVGYEPAKKLALINTVEPIWITDDPQGDDSALWRQIPREEIAQLLVEAS